MLKLILKVMVFLYNVSGGRIGGKMGKAPVLLLTTTGRKTGKQRTLPLIYIMDGSAYVITASAGGADKHPGWFFNIRSNPQATIQVRNLATDGLHILAVTMTDRPNNLFILSHLLISHAKK